MTWDIRLLDDHLVVELVYAGALSEAELTESVHAAKEMGATMPKVLVLSDCRQLAAGHSVVDLYFLADTVSAGVAGHRFKEAVLLPALPEAGENVHFWETTCFNRGMEVRVFADRQLALDWLVQD